MRRRFTAMATLLILGALVTPHVSAQIFDVTIREINAIPQDSIDALNAAGETLDDPRIENAIFNDLVGDTVRVRAVVMSDPTLSGLSSPNNQGLPSRVHFFVRDTAAVTQGVEGMGLQIVDGSWQENGVLGLLVGDVVEIVGTVSPFDEVLQVSPVSITPLGTYTDFGLPASVLDPVVITTADAMKVVGSANQANWDNLASLRAQYVRIENAVVQRRDISSDRPNWTISTDGGTTQLYHRDLSLAYRNDRDGSYDDSQFRVFFDDFVPPPPGSGVNLQGFLFMDDFDPFAVGTDPDVLIKLSPMEREDLEITITPPIVSEVSRPTSVVLSSETVDITANVAADPTRTLSSVELKYYTVLATDTLAVTGTLVSGSTYSFTIPGQAEYDFVAYWISATDNVGAESQPVLQYYRVGGISQILDIQVTPDGGEGDSPYAGMTVPMSVRALVGSNPDSSGIYAVQTPLTTDAWTGILLRPEGEVLNLKRGDVIDITEAEVEERFGVTQLRNMVFTVVGSGNQPNFKTVPTSALVDPSIAEQHEGMMLRFENVTIVNDNEGFGEWSFSSDGTAENAIKADDASDAIGSSYAADAFEAGDVVAFIQGIAWYSFGEFKLVPESSLDIGGINVATEDFEVPGEFALRQNYPNPFNPSTTIQYDVPSASRVSIRVFDMLGREVATLVEGDVAAGTHTVSFDARNLASGVYVYRMEAAGTVTNRSMMLLK